MREGGIGIEHALCGSVRISRRDTAGGIVTAVEAMFYFFFLLLTAYVHALGSNDDLDRRPSTDPHVTIHLCTCGLMRRAHRSIARELLHGTGQGRTDVSL